MGILKVYTTTLIFISLLKFGSSEVGNLSPSSATAMLNMAFKRMDIHTVYLPLSIQLEYHRMGVPYLIYAQMDSGLRRSDNSSNNLSSIVPYIFRHRGVKKQISFGHVFQNFKHCDLGEKCEYSKLWYEAWGRLQSGSCCYNYNTVLNVPSNYYSASYFRNVFYFINELHSKSQKKLELRIVTFMLFSESYSTNPIAWSLMSSGKSKIPKKATYNHNNAFWTHYKHIGSTFVKTTNFQNLNNCSECRLLHSIIQSFCNLSNMYLPGTKLDDFSSAYNSDVSDNGKETNMPIVGSFSFDTWSIIIVAYVITTIIFGVVKLFNSLDDSWCEFMLSQCANFFKCKRKLAYQSDFIQTVESVTCKSSSDECKTKKKTEFDKRRGNLVNQTRYSIFVLHGTLKLLSIMLIVMHEGRVYFDISRSKLIYYRYVTPLNTSRKNYSYSWNNEASRNSQHLDLLPDDESLNIKDCLNWVESESIKDNRICVGYEFELRNLHKSHELKKPYKLDKNIIHGNRLQAHKRRLLSKLPRLSKFRVHVIENGIMHLWRIFETSLSETVGLGAIGRFAIKDYLGLFGVYSMLLLLSTLLFVLEIIYHQFQKYWSNDCLNLMKRQCHNCRRRFQYLIRSFNMNCCINRRLNRVHNV